MSKLDHLIDNKIIRNISVWAFIYVIALVSIQSDNVVLSAFIVVVFLAIPIYIHNLKILPLFFSKKIALGSFLLIVNITVFTAIGVYFFSNSMGNFEWRMLYNMIGILALVLFVGSALKIATDSFIRRQQDKDAELKLLKAQLNPHFLFNTLNNLYGLSVVKSDKLPDLMLKLSDLLRYSLYDTRDSYVPLEKEIIYLENYIALEKIRLGNNTTIQFTKSGDMSSMVIAPMLLIVFVENAFKHLSNSKDKSNKVIIDIEVINDSLIFTCVNSIDKKITDLSIASEKSGIGLKNAKKRLNLIYKEKHKINITEKLDSYHVELILQM